LPSSLSPDGKDALHPVADPYAVSKTAAGLDGNCPGNGARTGRFHDSSNTSGVLSTGRNLTWNSEGAA
jgi:hypothetical protein